MLSPRVTDFNLTFGGGRVAGQRVGYLRVSGFDQNPDRQLENLDEMDRTFIDMASGKDTHRPQLEARCWRSFVRVTRSWCTAWIGLPATSTICAAW